MQGIRADQLLYHNGKPIVNGMFGVKKAGKEIKCADGVVRDVLRLIINLVPSNDIQIPWEGDSGDAVALGKLYRLRP